MDDKDFKKHLKDLAHGHHHPEEHDWGGEKTTQTTAERAPAKAVKRTAKKSRTARS
jgi:hypothetical protein